MSSDNVIPMSLDSFVTYVLDLYNRVQSNAPIDAKAGVRGMPESLAQYLLAIVRFGIVEVYRGEVIKGWE